MLELAHLFLVEELDLAALVDPGLALLNELLGPGGHVLVLLSQSLGCHQVALQPLAFIDRVLDVFVPQHLLHLSI